MLKVLKNGIVVTSILLSLTGCQSELNNEDLKGLKACYVKPTGIALWSNDILQVTNSMMKIGLNVSVLQDGSELIIDMGDDDKIVLEEIDYKDSNCYEVQSIQGKKGELFKGNGDNFLLASAMFFGRLSVTDGDKEKWKVEEQNRQNEKSGKMKQTNKKLEMAKLENNRFKEFLKKFNNLSSSNNLNNIANANSLVLKNTTLNSLKNLIVKNKEFNISLFDEFISNIDYILNIPEDERENNKNDLFMFSSKYSRFVSDLNSEASKFSYKITSIQDEIADINDRY